jgi:CheY-like chemotaxis protein/anti-sigma regulatory factor (Ser/Thr protein kinase)
MTTPKQPAEANDDGSPVPPPARENEITALVVDDAAIDRRMAGAIIEQQLGWRVIYAEDGTAALEAMQRETPRVVLTDMRMPGTNGLELVAAIRRKYSNVPVVLMTAYGNEDIAIQALKEGAASYVPKRCQEQDLATTLEQVVSAAKLERRHQRLLETLTQIESHFILDNDRTLIPALVTHVQSYVGRLQLCDQTGSIRIGVALEETLLNAIFHGNLEAHSDLRQQGEERYYQLADERRQQLPYRDRHVFFHFKLTRAEAVFCVRDEGHGFDPSKLPDPTDPENLGRVGGRGLLLIRTFMDDVSFNDQGNQITLVKRKSIS